MRLASAMSVVHLHSKKAFFDSQRHIAAEVGTAVKQAGQCRSGNVKGRARRAAVTARPRWFDNLCSDKSPGCSGFLMGMTFVPRATRVPKLFVRAALVEPRATQFGNTVDVSVAADTRCLPASRLVSTLVSLMNNSKARRRDDSRTRQDTECPRHIGYRYVIVFPNMST